MSLGQINTKSLPIISSRELCTLLTFGSAVVSTSSWFGDAATIKGLQKMCPWEHLWYIRSKSFYNLSTEFMTYTLLVWIYHIPCGDTFIDSLQHFIVPMGSALNNVSTHDCHFNWQRNRSTSFNLSHVTNAIQASYTQNVRTIYGSSIAPQSVWLQAFRLLACGFLRW